MKKRWQKFSDISEDLKNKYEHIDKKSLNILNHC